MPPTGGSASWGAISIFATESYSRYCKAICTRKNGCAQMKRRQSTLVQVLDTLLIDWAYEGVASVVIVCPSSWVGPSTVLSTVDQEYWIATELRAGKNEMGPLQACKDTGGVVIEFDSCSLLARYVVSCGRVAPAHA